LAIVCRLFVDARDGIVTDKTEIIDKFYPMSNLLVSTESTDQYCPTLNNIPARGLSI